MHGINHVHKNSLCRSLRAPCACWGLPETLNQSPKSIKGITGEEWQLVPLGCSLCAASEVNCLPITAFTVNFNWSERGKKSSFILFFSERDFSFTGAVSWYLLHIFGKRHQRINILWLKWKKKKEKERKKFTNKKMLLIFKLTHPLIIPALLWLDFSLPREDWSQWSVTSKPSHSCTASL